MAPLTLPQDAVNVILTGVAPAATPPISAVSDKGVLPPEARFVLPADMLVRLMTAPENAKSVLLFNETPDTVALTVKVAAPAAEPVAEEMPTVAVPVESVKAVGEVSVANAELILKLTSLF